VVEAKLGEVVVVVVVVVVEGRIERVEKETTVTH
jgi:hypothetical protein